MSSVYFVIRDQAGHWVLSHIWTACHQNSIWPASKSFLINETYALVLRVIMLNNSIKILLVSFVHHIELQNFLNTPHTSMPIHITESRLASILTNFLLRTSGRVGWNDKETVTVEYGMTHPSRSWQLNSSPSVSKPTSRHDTGITVGFFIVTDWVSFLQPHHSHQQSSTSTTVQ